MILDTKQSGVKTITGQLQRVILPRLFDATLQLLYVLCLVLDGDDTAIEAFALDFSDAFWQIPIAREEQKYYCATGLIDGKKEMVRIPTSRSGLGCRTNALGTSSRIGHAPHTVSLQVN